MEAFLSELASVATKKSFKKHAILLYQGEAPRTAYVLLKGTIKIYSINSAGEEQVVDFHTQNDIFPASWLFGKASTTLYYYEALTDCEVLAIPRDELQHVMAGKPRFVQAVLDYYVTNYVGTLMRVTALEQSRASDKIMFTLYYLLFRYGREVRPGVFVIGLSLTHAVIASLVGLTRETTTTQLNRLKRQGVVQYNVHTYTVSKTKLENLLGEDSFRNLSMREPAG
ncbi:MAG TPA: Crp/Fnr family transcriptional regulator [Candidatus Saccharimonadales bacterium]|nr:Crp/Fnr family transcriptional regulator [Candidatus Saccharimonadales bacterium]